MTATQTSTSRGTQGFKCRLSSSSLRRAQQVVAALDGPRAGAVSGDGADAEVGRRKPAALQELWRQLQAACLQHRHPVSHGSLL